MYLENSMPAEVDTTNACQDDCLIDSCWGTDCLYILHFKYSLKYGYLIYISGLVQEHIVEATKSEHKNANS